MVWFHTDIGSIVLGTIGDGEHVASFGVASWHVNAEPLVTNMG